MAIIYINLAQIFENIHGHGVAIDTRPRIYCGYGISTNIVLSAVTVLQLTQFASPQMLPSKTAKLKVNAHSQINGCIERPIEYCLMALLYICHVQVGEMLVF